MPALWLTAAALVVVGGIPVVLLVRRAAREASATTEALTGVTGAVRGELPAVTHGITHLQARVDAMVRNPPRWRTTPGEGDERARNRSGSGALGRSRHRGRPR